MHRSDFKLIASVLKEYTGSEGRSIAIALASKLHRTNERFDVQRFLKACGIEDYDASWITGPYNKDWH